jgi:squalene-associated FAD-dependent desaturase
MSTPRVAIVGGGLAGLAAAVALVERGVAVELFESRQTLGGRAGSFRDPESDDLVDHCQHVAMGCCTAFLDFCRRTGIYSLLRRDRVLHFIGPDGAVRRFAAAPWLPAPLHLAPAFLGLGYLSLRERFGIAGALAKLCGTNRDASADELTIGQWLRAGCQSERAVERFWAVLLTSALGETVERASVAAARKVLVDGFMTSRDAYEIYVPRVPLGEWYDGKIAGWLRARGAKLHTATSVSRLAGGERGVDFLQMPDRQNRQFDCYVVATPWHKTHSLLSPELARAIPSVNDAAKLESSAITGVHLWFDRPITRLPHAVLVGRLSQWVFARPVTCEPSISHEHYYQVVISASQEIASHGRPSIAEQVAGELRQAFPRAREAKLLRSRVVTQRDAVFSPRPGSEQLRPEQRTPVPNLFLAGDWTKTGWPATMESAVRSGYLAADAVLERVKEAFGPVS